MRTPNFESYRGHWLSFKSSQQFWHFQVRSCESVHLILALTPGGNPLYEVILGVDVNKKSRILRYSQDSGLPTTVLEEDTPGILNCVEGQRFWLSWRNGKIELALRSSNGKRLLDWNDNQPMAVYAVSLVTGPGDVGEWIYSSDSG